jgi:antirestriction protein ArdC
MVSNGQTPQEKITATLSKILQLFKTGNVPQAIAIATFPPFDVPSNLWSLSNRIIMMLSGTSDARGFQQWHEVGRHVRKGEKAFHILAPRMTRKGQEHDADITEDDPKDAKYVLTGFIPVSVFAVEQTEGEPLAYQKIELPKLPLMEKAQEWGIDVASVAFQGTYYGAFQDGTTEKIRLATPHEKTFFHELAHAGHKRINGTLQPGQNPKQEIVAELAAQTLCQMVGKELESTLGNSYDYISEHAKKMNRSVERACLSLLSDVEKILKMILE